MNIAKINDYEEIIKAAELYMSCKWSIGILFKKMGFLYFDGYV